MLKFISDHPVLISLIFLLINAIWIAFTYFNGIRHARIMEYLKHSYNLDKEKRIKMYAMKAGQFEKYYRMIDDFGKKQQVDMPRRFQPIYNEYLEDYLKAANSEDSFGVTRAITKFTTQLSDIVNEGQEQYLSIKSETHSLKLIASAELALVFDELQSAYDSAFKDSQIFLSEIVTLTEAKDIEQMQALQDSITRHGKKIEEIADRLMEQMRKELNEI